MDTLFIKLIPGSLLFVTFLLLNQLNPKLLMKRHGLLPIQSPKNRTL